MCCRQRQTLIPLWGILISGMRPCGWHGTTEVVVPFQPSTIFHSAPFVFHLEKQNCSPFSFCKNMASQKALREVSITAMVVLWLPQHAVSDPRSQTKTLAIRVMAQQITRNVANLELLTLSVTEEKAYNLAQLQFIRNSKYTVVDRWARLMQGTMSADTVPLNETWAFLSEETHGGNTVSIWISRRECGRVKSLVWGKDSIVLVEKMFLHLMTSLVFLLQQEKFSLMFGEIAKMIVKHIADT